MPYVKVPLKSKIVSAFNLKIIKVLPATSDALPAYEKLYCRCCLPVPCTSCGQPVQPRPMLHSLQTINGVQLMHGCIMYIMRATSAAATNDAIPTDEKCDAYDARLYLVHHASHQRNHDQRCIPCRGTMYCK